MVSADWIIRTILDVNSIVIARFHEGELVRWRHGSERGTLCMVERVFMGQILARPVNDLDVIWVAGPDDLRHEWEPED